MDSGVNGQGEVWALRTKYMQINWTTTVLQ